MCNIHIAEVLFYKQKEIAKRAINLDFMSNLPKLTLSMECTRCFIDTGKGSFFKYCVPVRS